MARRGRKRVVGSLRRVPMGGYGGRCFGYGPEGRSLPVGRPWLRTHVAQWRCPSRGRWWSLRRRQRRTPGGMGERRLGRRQRRSQGGMCERRLGRRQRRSPGGAGQWRGLWHRCVHHRKEHRRAEFFERRQWRSRRCAPWADGSALRRTRRWRDRTGPGDAARTGVAGNSTGNLRRRQGWLRHAAAGGSGCRRFDLRILGFAHGTRPEY
jgi:hypothetical protein